MRTVYLDHNATSPLRPEARQRWLEVVDEMGGNPSSVHQSGRRARDRVDEARAVVAEALGVAEGEVIFTSGGTEANNAALSGALEAPGRPPRLVTSQAEHSSVLEPARRLARRATSVELLPVDREGRPRMDALLRALGIPTGLVSLSAANNEVGCLTPLEQVADHVRSRAPSPRPWLHTDAVQALGRVPVDLRGWNVDLASFSAHKVGGPPGVGVLWVRSGIALEPLLLGGGQEQGRRAGTEDVPAISAAALAIQLAVREQGQFHRRTSALCRSLWNELAGSLSSAKLVGPPIDSTERLPNTLNVLLSETDGRVLVTRLDLEGLEVSAGSACASGSLKPSHVLLAMGYDEDEARAGLRLSLGRDTTRDDCAQAVDILEKLCVTSRAT